MQQRASPAAGINLGPLSVVSQPLASRTGQCESCTGLFAVGSAVAATALFGGSGARIAPVAAAAPPAAAPAAKPAGATDADLARQLFEVRAAPLLAKHCLECHDPATRKGRLDLWLKASALAGGKKGPAIVPGKSADSRLWQAVAAGDMPPDDRPP